VLLTHSAGGYPGWRTAQKNPNVKGIVAYEPVGWTFPVGEAPAPITTAAGAISALTVSLPDFMALTKIPIQIVWGDNIPDMTHPSVYPGIDIWRARLEISRLFVKAINDHGGNAQLLHLPEAGVHGNTHFVMSDLNNEAIADLLSDFLKQQKLDRGKLISQN